MPPAEDLVRLLEAWMPGQRWYPAKGRGVGVRLLAATPVPAEPSVQVVVLVLGLDSGDRWDVVQVPLTLRGAARAELAPALVGTVEDTWVYDAPYDPAYLTALLATLERPPGRDRIGRPSEVRVLTGEQSNTSVIAQTSDGPVIVKVFRTLHPGENPDVAVLRALTGLPLVPGLVGWANGTWSAADGTEVAGHLAVATTFVTDGRDAWREAVDAVAAGADFSGPAFSLGAATAALHQALAEAFGTTDVDEAGRLALVDALRDRVDWALGATDALAHHRGALRAWADRLDLVGLPPLQRVHGDYHLGQVLHSATGWVVLDFEGEPLRPLAERTVPDLALRDVAGMLRSFDYAAGQVRVFAADPAAATAAEAWATAARDAFCAGYATVAGHDPRERVDLLGALELDKALYEVVYEAGNRPAWIDVPLGAVTRLLG